MPRADDNRGTVTSLGRKAGYISEEPVECMVGTARDRRRREPPADADGGEVSEAPFSELESFVRTEVGLRTALQEKLTAAEAELAALRTSAGSGGGVGAADLEAREQALA